MRFITILLAIVASLGGSYGAFITMRAVGPEDRTNEFGYGDATTASPNGGDLFESRNFALVVAALKRELGPEGRLTYLTVERTEARAMAQVDGHDRSVEVDASGRSKAQDGDRSSPTGLVPVSRLDPAAIDKLVREATLQSGAPVETLTLQGGSREWTVDTDEGEPDSFIANLDGGGLRLSGEPNPVPIGGSPDSLLRAENLARVAAAARKEAPADARLTDFDIRPNRVGLELQTGGRELTLDYGYDAVLTSRTLRAKTGVDGGSVGWEALDPEAPERMVRSAAKRLDVKGLDDVEYVLLSLPSPVPGSKPGLSMYFSQGHDPLYVSANLHGRKLAY